MVLWLGRVFVVHYHGVRAGEAVHWEWTVWVALVSDNKAEVSVRRGRATLLAVESYVNHKRRADEEFLITACSMDPL